MQAHTHAPVRAHTHTHTHARTHSTYAHTQTFPPTPTHPPTYPPTYTLPPNLEAAAILRAAVTGVAPLVEDGVVQAHDLLLPPKGQPGSPTVDQTRHGQARPGPSPRIRRVSTARVRARVGFALGEARNPCPEEEEAQVGVGECSPKEKGKARRKGGMHQSLSQYLRRWSLCSCQAVPVSTRG